MLCDKYKYIPEILIYLKLQFHGFFYCSSDDQDEEEIGYESNEDEDKKATEKVRKYQVNRLKYYYGVAEFNSPIAANKVYIDCDQSEYELSATKFDLRFIPEDMEFNDDPPTGLFTFFYIYFVTCLFSFVY